MTPSMWPAALTLTDSPRRPSGRHRALQGTGVADLHVRAGRDQVPLAVHAGDHVVLLAHQARDLVAELAVVEEAYAYDHAGQPRRAVGTERRPVADLDEVEDAVPRHGHAHILAWRGPPWGHHS